MFKLKDGGNVVSLMWLMRKDMNINWFLDQFHDIDSLDQNVTSTYLSSINFKSITGFMYVIKRAYTNDDNDDHDHDH